MACGRGCLFTALFIIIRACGQPGLLRRGSGKIISEQQLEFIECLLLTLPRESILEGQLSNGILTKCFGVSAGFSLWLIKEDTES